MSDKAVDDCLASLKFVADWFVTSNMKIYADENILYLIKILIMPYLLVMEWVFLT